MSIYMNDVVNNLCFQNLQINKHFKSNQSFGGGLSKGYFGIILRAKMKLLKFGDII